MSFVRVCDEFLVAKWTWVCSPVWHRLWWGFTCFLSRIYPPLSSISSALNNRCCWYSIRMSLCNVTFRWYTLLGYEMTELVQNRVKLINIIAATSWSSGLWYQYFGGPCCLHFQGEDFTKRCHNPGYHRENHKTRFKITVAFLVGWLASYPHFVSYDCT